MFVQGEEHLRYGREQQAIPLFQAVAAEWKRFGIEHTADATDYALGYAKFMEALATHLGKNRFAAIRLYNEVMDIYQDYPEIKAEALYWRGRAFFDNSDLSKGVADWHELADDPELMGNPLASAAMNNLAEDAWNKGKWEDAMRYWKRACDNSPTVAVDFENDTKPAFRYIRVCSYLGRWNDMTAYFEDLPVDLNRQTALMSHFITQTWYWTLQHRYWLDYFRRTTKSETEAIEKSRKYMLDLTKWYEEQEPKFAEVSEARRWENIMNVVLYRAVLAPKESKDYMTRIAAEVRAIPNKELRLQRIVSMIDRLGQGKMVTEGRTMLELIENPQDRMWQAGVLEDRAENYKEAANYFTQLMKDPDVELAARARWYYAEMCRYRSGDWETAIKLYQECNNPPHNLWALSEVYRRAGKKKEAQTVLSEIVAMFPDHAAMAMFRKGEYFEQDGQRSDAVGAYRKIITNPEWKKSNEASRASQILDQWGEKIGEGALVNQVR